MFNLFNYVFFIANNFQQLKQITIVRKSWTPLNIIILVFVCLSLLLQFLVAFILIFISKHEDLNNETKRDSLIKNNNVTLLLVVLISIINIGISIASCF